MKQSLMTVKEFAARKGVHISTVHKWIINGLLTGVVRDGWTLMIPEKNLSVEPNRPGRPRGRAVPPPSAEDASVRFERSRKYYPRRFNITFEELRKLFDEGRTYQEIADELGVTRQRVEQIYNVYVRPVAGESGRSRRAAIVRKKQIKNAQKSFFSHTRIRELMTIIESAGLDVTCLTTKNNRNFSYANVLEICGRKCKVLLTRTARHQSPSSLTRYYRLTITQAILQAEFLIAMVGEDMDALSIFVVPTSVLKGLIGSVGRKTMYIPEKAPEPSDNNRGMLNWWSYQNKWELLQEAEV